MTLTGTALRMTVFVGESEQVHHRPLYTEIVHRAHVRGLAGATVLRGCEGFGASGRIHTTRILSLTEDLPVVILIVDAAQKIRDFLPEVEELVAEGLVILDEVEVVHHAGRDVEPAREDGPGRTIETRRGRSRSGEEHR